MKYTRLKEAEQKGAVKAICGALVDYIENDPDSTLDILGTLLETLESFDCDDFFGTEGWQRGLGLEDLEGLTSN